MPSRPSASGLPTLGDQPAEVRSLLGVVVVAGPPALPAAAGIVLFALLLIGPFVLILTLVALAALVALAGALVASPYLLVRHLRRHRRAAAVGAPAPQLVSAPVPSTRVAA